MASPGEVLRPPDDAKAPTLSIFACKLGGSLVCICAPPPIPPGPLIPIGIGIPPRAIIPGVGRPGGARAAITFWAEAILVGGCGRGRDAGGLGCRAGGGAAVIGAEGDGPSAAGVCGGVS